MNNDDADADKNDANNNEDQLLEPDVNDDDDDADNNKENHLSPPLLEADGEHLPLRRIPGVATQTEAGHLGQI